MPALERGGRRKYARSWEEGREEESRETKKGRDGWRQAEKGKRGKERESEREEALALTPRMFEKEREGESPSPHTSHVCGRGKRSLDRSSTISAMVA